MEMVQPSSDDSQRDFTVRRVVAIVLVGFLLFSAVGGVIGSGIAAAQQAGSSANNTTAGGTKPANGSSPRSGNDAATITKKEFRQWFQQLEQMDQSEAQQEVKTSPRMTRILASVYRKTVGSSASTDSLIDSIESRPKYTVKMIRQTVGDGPIPAPVAVVNDTGGGSGENGSSGGNAGNNSSDGPTSNSEVNQVIQEFKEQNLGFTRLSKENQSKVTNILLELSKKNVSQQKQDKLLNRLERIFASATPGDIGSPKLQKQRQDVIATLLKARKEPPDILPNINIPSLLDIKLDALADSLMDSVGNLLTDVYTLIFDTPVPVNSGWHQILGEPTNDPFKTLYVSLMEERLYPVMQYLLGIALIFLAGAVAIPQFRYRNRIVDLLINLVAGITLFYFAWPAVTFLHGVTNQITMFILPNASEVASSATNLVSMAGAPVAMYLFGAGGLFTTLFVLGVEVGLRRVLLIYLLPYLFGPVLLIRFVSPWGRLRNYASMFLWQYVNVLAMVIPLAIIMRAIIAIKWNFSVSGFGAVLVIIALFLCMIAIPILSTWFFLQVPSKVNARVQSVASGARKRAPSARDAFGGARSAVDTTATGGRAVHDRAKSMVGAARTAGPSFPSLPSSSSGSDTATDTSATSSSSGSDTTAGEIRDLHRQQNSDPMSAESQKSTYIEHYTGDDALPSTGVLGD